MHDVDLLRSVRLGSIRRQALAKTSPRRIRGRLGRQREKGRKEVCSRVKVVGGRKL